MGSGMHDCQILLLPETCISTKQDTGWGAQVFAKDQALTFEFEGTNFVLTVSSVLVVDAHGEQKSTTRGLLIPDTTFVFETSTSSGIKVTGQRSVVAPQLFKDKEFNFEKLGIGGLDIQFEQIFRRAFASR